MPIYEYYCSKCDKEFQLKRLIAELKAPAHCPKCGEEGSRLVTAFSSKVGLHLKTPSNSVYRENSAQKNTKAKKAVMSKKSK